MGDGLGTITMNDMQTRHRFESLDAIRGICACMVALYHFHTMGWINNAPLIQHAALFVDFFFVLSGFVIAVSYGDKLAQGYSTIKFLGLRLGRVYPLHFAALLLLVATEVAFAVLAPHIADRAPFAGENSPVDILYNLGLIQIFVGDPLSWNMPSWSIAAEFWTYVAFALLWRLAGRRAWLATIPIAVIGLGLLAIFPVQHLVVFQAWSVVRCLVGFSLGVLAYEIYRRAPVSLNESASTALEVGVTITLAVFVSYAHGLLMLATPVLFMGAVLVFAAQRGLLSQMLLWRPLQFVGELSYSIYMLHYFVQLRMVNALSLIERLLHHRVALIAHNAGRNEVGLSPTFGDAMSLAMLAVVVMFAWAGFNWIDRPGRLWSRRILNGRPKPALATEREAPAF